MHTSLVLVALMGPGAPVQFIDRQIDTHERVVALFRRQSRSGDDPDARRLAGQLLPTLEEQLAQLRHLRA